MWEMLTEYGSRTGHESSKLFFALANPKVRLDRDKTNGKTISGETLFSQINFTALTTTAAVLDRFTVANAGNSLQGGETALSRGRQERQWKYQRKYQK